MVGGGGGGGTTLHDRKVDGEIASRPSENGIVEDMD